MHFLLVRPRDIERAELDGSRVAAVRGDGVGEIWQLPTLDGEPSFDDLVKCRAPYHISGHSLVVRKRMPGDCRRQPAADR